MPIDANGRFIPQVSMPLNTQQAGQQATQVTPMARPLAATNQIAMQQARPALQTQMATQQAQPQFQTQMAVSQNRPQFWLPPSRIARDPGFFQPGAPDPNAPAPPPAPPPPAPPVQGQPAVRPTMGPAPVQMYGMSQLGAPAPQGPVGGPSATQMAGRGNAQSVSNYLTALNQAGAQTNNAAMNAPGQMGAGPQAGFQGFGVNGQQVYANPVMAGGAYNPGLQYQANQASANANYNVGNYAQQGYQSGLNQYGNAYAPTLANTGYVNQGGTGGLVNQPQWQTPQPWGNQTMNEPGAQGSGWGGGSSQDWEKYFNAGPNDLPPGYQGQQGAFYGNQPTLGPGSGQVTSDVAAKENIQPAQDELQEFLDALGVYSYEYKDKKYGEGRRISPMAQEIEKTPLGANAISTNAEGYKQVDYGKLAGTQLAALALLNHKYNQLEIKLKKAIGENLKKRGK